MKEIVKMKNKNNSIYSFIAISLTLLVPVAGRFAYAIVLVLAINIFLLFGTLFRKLIYKIHLQPLQPVLMSIFLIGLAIFYKQLLIIYSPVIALTLGFSIYVSAFSSFKIGSLYKKSEQNLSFEISENMKAGFKFSIFALCFFLFRDIFGYGTISFPIREGLACIKLRSDSKLFASGVFWSSIPGALILIALIFVISAYINKRIQISNSIYKKNNNSEEGKK